MFKDMLRSLRVLRGYSMDEFVEKYNEQFDTKMNKSTLSRYENGLQEPMYSTVVNLAKFFGVSTDHLIDDKSMVSQSNSRDLDISRIERARKRMPEKERDKMMKILEASFEDFFSDDYIDEDTDE